MNIAGKGVLLLGVFVAIGIIVLNEGFSDTSQNGESLPVIQSAEETNEPSNKSEEERKKIYNGFYKNFCDVFIEVLKGYTISKKELQKIFRSCKSLGDQTCLF